MLKVYLQLLRIPGVFTAVSNVLMGFMLSQTPIHSQILLIPLLISSGLLYFSGMILNDYFDYGVDKTQRPTRPLPSGKISRQSALILGIIFLSCANLAALFVGIQTILLTMIISSLILLYNIKIKSITSIGVLVLCLIRVLNVYLGFTVIGFTLNFALIPIPLAFLVASIGILSRVETKSASSKTVILNLIMIVLSVTSLLTILSQNDKYYYLIFLSMFIGLITYSSVKFGQKNSISIQNKITYHLLSIILLDATLVAAFSDMLYATIIASLFVPAYLLAKKIYLT
ncbi:MAG: UbiA family prenyltransferase [Thaumarchaeota archaeon]|nr:UbiA family prenyltransferase [Nitrososphaerota archaeon]